MSSGSLQHRFCVLVLGLILGFAYPFVNLETAITRAQEFFDKEQRNAANWNVAVKHWGFVEGSSNGASTLAALTSFGLLQDDGIGEKRKVRLTQSALRILLDKRPDSKERAELIKQAALAPKIHQQLWDKWGNDLPSDVTLRHTKAPLPEAVGAATTPGDQAIHASLWRKWRDHGS